MMAITPDVASKPWIGQVKDIGDDREDRGKVDEAGEQILQQLAFARPALDDDEGAQKAHHEPGRP